MVHKTVRLVVGLAAAAYLLNLGFGIVEFVPDNIPIIGNIDEGFAAVVADEFLFSGAIRKVIENI